VRARSFREFLIPKDNPWNPKNEKYARCLNSVLEYVESLPPDHPAFLKLEAKECDEDEDGLTWAGVIHCDTTDPAGWFADWAGLNEEGGAQ
jgi:hypothetical protein